MKVEYTSSQEKLSPKTRLGNYTESEICAHEIFV